MQPLAISAITTLFALIMTHRDCPLLFVDCHEPKEKLDRQLSYRKPLKRVAQLSDAFAHHREKLEFFSAAPKRRRKGNIGAAKRKLQLPIERA